MNTHKTKRAVKYSLFLALGAAVARAHIVDQINSVHFHSSMPDFGTLPRRGIVRLRGEYDDRISKEQPYMAFDERAFVELSPEQDERADKAREQARAEPLNVALKAERNAQWHEARQAYEQAGAKFGWTGELRDRVELLRQVEGMRMPLRVLFVDALRLYLSVVPVVEDRTPERPADAPEETPEQGKARQAAEAKALEQKRAAKSAALEKVYAEPAAGFVREHALYQLASLAYERQDYPQARARYQQALKEFPRGEKREATLMMLARAALLPEADAKRDMVAGEATLAQLEREFPRTRFRKAVDGLRGRADFLRKRYEAAIQRYLALGDLESVETIRKMLSPAKQKPLYPELLAGYLRRLASAKNYDAYSRALFGIDRAQQKMSAGDAARFSQRLLNDSDLAASYLYYRLYHTENKPLDLRSLTLLADRLSLLPEAKIAPLVRTRLAEVYYQRGQYAKVLRWLEKAETPQTRDRALFVRGATHHKLQQLQPAIAAFNRLLARCPESPLRRSAREELAILHEATGDRASALEQYFAIGYSQDIAFLLDIRMTEHEIEQVLEKHPNHRQRDLLAYTLGMRYMRDERWREAEEWLRRVPAETYAKFSKVPEEDIFFDHPSPDPLTAIHDLSALYQAVKDARSDETRAEALFKYASYYSTHGTLLLYNAPLWQQRRQYGFQFWWNKKQATAQDTGAVRVHMYSHEVYVRSRRICLELARRYPKSAVAPEALYRAACCARRLARFNAWWSEENKRFNAWDESVRLMNRVASEYPNHPLASHAKKYAGVFAAEKTAEW